uniref:ATP synthase F0 subunit 8 n=1 Tax=Acrobeloides nanus TaxID=290746 RepID=A0A914CNZ4_9BILA
MIMGAYMYGLGILFLCFCYYEIWARNRHRSTPQKVKTLIRLSTVKSDPRKNNSNSIESILLRREILTAGSLFLRIGCVGGLFTR